MVEIALNFPEVIEGSSHGRPALRVGKKFLTLLNTEREPSMVLVLGSVDEQQHLIEIDPELYHITPHYEGWHGVLMRLEHASKEDVTAYIDRRFREVATKRAIRALDEQGG